MSKTSALVDVMIMLLDEAIEDLLKSVDYKSRFRKEDASMDAFCREVDEVARGCDGYARTYVSAANMVEKSIDDPLGQNHTYARVWPGLGVLMKLRDRYRRISAEL